jgi:hypothetical protein
MVANHPGMSDQTNSNLPRDGAAKRTQTSIPIHGGMKDQTEASKLAIAPNSPGFGSDASGPDVLDPAKGLKKFGPVGVKWNMKDGMGDGLNTEIGGQVLSEAALLGR